MCLHMHELYFLGLAMCFFLDPVASRRQNGDRGVALDHVYASPMTTTTTVPLQSKIGPHSRKPLGPLLYALR